MFVKMKASLFGLKQNDLLLLFCFCNVLQQLFLNECILQIILRRFLVCLGQILTQLSKKQLVRLRKRQESQKCRKIPNLTCIWSTAVEFCKITIIPWKFLNYFWPEYDIWIYNDMYDKVLILIM